MKKTTKTFLALTIISVICICGWITVRTVKNVSFDKNCIQYIERAANANTVELAKEELKKAISYAESKNLTKGRVSIFLNQPKNDIGYWYKNLKTSYEELENLPSDASTVEKTNALMNLRETLTDSTADGTIATYPDGISIYPNNKIYFILIIVFSIGTIAFGNEFLKRW